MKDMFDKAFFRFLLGFVSIVAVSFIILTVVGNYDKKQNMSKVELSS